MIKRAIGIIMIIIGIVWEVLVLWILLTLGGDRIGAAAMFIFRIIVIVIGRN